VWAYGHSSFVSYHAARGATQITFIPDPGNTSPDSYTSESFEEAGYYSCSLFSSSYVFSFFFDA
jgi:hypothetical protein